MVDGLLPPRKRGASFWAWSNGIADRKGLLSCSEEASCCPSASTPRRPPRQKSHSAGRSWTKGQLEDLRFGFHSSLNQELRFAPKLTPLPVAGPPAAARKLAAAKGGAAKGGAAATPRTGPPMPPGRPPSKLPSEMQEAADAAINSHGGLTPHSGTTTRSWTKNQLTEVSVAFHSSLNTDLCFHPRIHPEETLPSPMAAAFSGFAPRPSALLRRGTSYVAV